MLNGRKTIDRGGIERKLMQPPGFGYAREGCQRSCSRSADPCWSRPGYPSSLDCLNGWFGCPFCRLCRGIFLACEARGACRCDDRGRLGRSEVSWFHRERRGTFIHATDTQGNERGMSGRRWYWRTELWLQDRRQARCCSPDRYLFTALRYRACGIGNRGHIFECRTANCGISLKISIWRNKWCPHQDSNPGPPDYKSGALPTEL